MGSIDCMGSIDGMGSFDCIGSLAQGESDHVSGHTKFVGQAEMKDLGETGWRK